MQVVWKALPGDYGSGPAYTQELSLVGKNNVAEKVKVMEKPGIFSKDFKVVCLQGFEIFGESHSGIKMR